MVLSPLPPPQDVFDSFTEFNKCFIMEYMTFRIVGCTQFSRYLLLRKILVHLVFLPDFTSLRLGHIAFSHFLS